MNFIGRSRPAIRVATRECRVVLDNSIVREYLSRNDGMQSIQSKEGPPEQNQEAVVQEEEEVLPDAESSILFVNEEPATPKTKQISTQKKEIAQLKIRVRSLKIHVKALQERLKDLPDESLEIQNRAVVDAVEDVVDLDPDVEMQNADVPNASAFNLGLSDSWTKAQLEEWQANGQLSVVCAELERFITEN